MVKRWLLRVSVLLLISAGLLAQPSDVSFQHFTTEQGLSNDRITSILKDRRGFMWFGTVNGLNRFDGQTFTIYRRNGKSSGLPGNYVVNDGLAQDHDGHIWVSTNRGLCRYDPQTEQFQAVLLPEQRDQLADNDFVSPVRFDRAGKGWFSSVARLYQLEPRTGHLTTFPLPAIRPGTYAIPFPDRKGRLWVQHWGAIYRFDPTTGQYTYFLGVDEKQPYPDKSPPVEALVESRSGQFFALTDQKGIFRYEPTADRFLQFLDHKEAVTSLAEDQLADGRPFLWLGTHNHIMTYLPSEKRFTEFTHSADDPLSYPAGTVITIWKDRQTGILWMGSSVGLIKVDPVTLKFGRKLLRNKTNRAPDPVEVVQQDSRNNNLYWVLAHHALYQWNRQDGTLQPVSTDPIPGNRQYFSMIQDGQGRLWIGMDAGLAIYEPQTGRWQIRRDIGPAGQNGKIAISAFCRDTGGRIWIGTLFDGLYWHDSVTSRIQRWMPQLPVTFPSNISRLQADSRGQVWGQTREGIFRLNPSLGQTRRIQLQGLNKTVQPSDKLHSTFFVNKEGQLWVSGIDFLVKADTNGHVRQTYTLANGLLADHVFDIREDRRGHLWLTSDNQLHEMNPNTGRFQYYNIANGLFGNTLFKQITMDRQGNLFTGYFGGFNYWQPDQLRQNTVPPPVVITRIRVNNQPRLNRQAIQLQPGETTLSVDFAALNFSQPDKNRYAYQLIGFDQDWLLTNDRTATYTNLEPGQYTLRVKAANNDGVWNETGVTLAVNVVPPFWKTIWFRLLVGMVVAGILYAIYQYRERQRKHLERIRDRIATDLHDDMGSTLSSIRIFSDVVQQQIAPSVPQAVPILQRISTSATTLSESMQDIIWTIQTKNDRLEDVVTRMREFGLKMAEAKGIAFHMQVSDQFEKTRLHVEQRRNLYLIFKESINNAVKYANPSRIDVCLTIESGKQLHLLIKDDGQGFDPETVQSGNGLPNLHKRAREIRGKLTLTARPGAGTEIELLTRI